MKVKELIEKLKEFHENLDVVVDNGYGSLHKFNVENEVENENKELIIICPIL